MFRRALDLSDQSARVRYEARTKYWTEQPGNLSPDDEARKAREADPDHFRLGLRLEYANLALAAERLGDREQARRSLQRLVELQGKYSPLAPVGEQFNLLLFKQWLARVAGDVTAADDLATQMLTFSRENLPGTPSEAKALQAVGRQQWARGALDQAAVSLEEAMTIWQRLRPGGVPVVETLHLLGRLMKERGDRRTALTHVEAAFEILNDRRTRRSGGDGALALLTAGGERGAVDINTDLVELLVTDGRFERAFHVLEQTRSRGLAEVLSARELRIRNPCLRRCERSGGGSRPSTIGRRPASRHWMWPALRRLTPTSPGSMKPGFGWTTLTAASPSSILGAPASDAPFR